MLSAFIPCSIGFSCLLGINVYILELLDHEQGALDAEARVSGCFLRFSLSSKLLLVHTLLTRQSCAELNEHLENTREPGQGASE